MNEASPFWRRVRELRKEIAIALYMQDHRHSGVFNTPEEAELKEGGYWDKARVLALRKVREESFPIKDSQKEAERK